MRIDGTTAEEDAHGRASVHVSELDTMRFGRSIARVDDVSVADLDELHRTCRGAGIEMVIARCPGDDYATIHALERAGYLLMETLVDYRGPVRDAPDSPMIRVASADDADEVAAVARSAFASYAGHYHADPRLSDDDCAEAYASWAERCATLDAADHLVVAELENRIVGFQAHRTAAPGLGQLLLVCVAPEARGRGLYRALGAQAQRWSVRQGHSELLAVCHQANLPSHRVFIGLGLTPARVTVTFHGWVDELRGPGE